MYVRGCDHMGAGLKPLQLGLTAGLLWALCVLSLGLMATFLKWGKLMVSVIGSVYIGYTSTVAGSLIGMVWAFFDGLAGGAVFAWLYNHIGRLVK